MEMQSWPFTRLSNNSMFVKLSSMSLNIIEINILTMSMRSGDVTGWAGNGKSMVPQFFS